MAINYIGHKAGIALGSAAALLIWSAGAHADLALNMPRGVTAISQNVYSLPKCVQSAHVDFLDLRGDRRGGIRRHVLVDLPSPQIARCGAGQVPRKYCGRGGLDGDSDADFDRHGGTCHQDAGQHVRCPGCRVDRQSHWLSVAMAISGDGNTITWTKMSGSSAFSPLRLRKSTTLPPKVNTICWRSIIRWWCRSARRSAS